MEGAKTPICELDRFWMPVDSEDPAVLVVRLLNTLSNDSIGVGGWTCAHAKPSHAPAYFLGRAPPPKAADVDLTALLSPVVRAKYTRHASMRKSRKGLTEPADPSNG